MSDRDDPKTAWPVTQNADPQSIWATVAPEGSPPPQVHLAPDANPTSDGGRFKTGRYEILGEIARGGMGAVLRGRDSELNRDLAVKVLLEKYRENPDVLRRFFEEAQIGGQLQHPGIVPIYDIGVFPDKRPFFAMKLVKGRTLADMLAERTSPADDLARFLTIFEQVAQTVAYAHSKHVIHRDLKPLNIMVGAFGEVQVMDWGLAKVLTDGGSRGESTLPDIGTVMSLIETARTDSDAAATTAGSKMGTPAYMPPEQARGEVDRLDERADVFGLGSILCEILTGQPAYTGRTQAETVRKAEFADLADARSRLDSCGADHELISITKTCLSAEPMDRPNDASAVSALILAHLSGVQNRLKKAEIAEAEASARANAEAAQAAAERSKRKMTMAVAAALLLAGAIGGGSFLAFLLYRHTQRAEAERAVTDALAGAIALRGAAERAGLSAAEPWKRALDAIELARYTILLRPPSPGLADNVTDVYAEIVQREAAARDQVHQTESDRRFVAELQEARLQATMVKDDQYKNEPKLAAYEEAFRRAGIIVGEGSPESIAARITSKYDVPLIAAALDDWARFQTDAGLKARLAAIARAIDPERNAIRDAIAKGDRPSLIAIARDPTPARNPAHSVILLASALRRAGALSEAISVLSAARREAPSDFWINQELGVYLGERGTREDLTEAVRFLTVATALRPDSPGIHLNLGIVLDGLGKGSEAEFAYRHSIGIKPDFAPAYRGLGFVLSRQGKLVEAEAALNRAIALDPASAVAYYNLAVTLGGQGKTAEVEAAFRQAIRIDPDYASAHCNLGDCLKKQGRFAEALTEFRTGHELGSKQPGWKYPSAKWVADCQALVTLEARLPALLRDEEKPKDNAERLALGKVCYETKRYATSVRFYGDALEHDLNLGEDRQAQHRYSAACSAALSGSSKGKDDPMPDEAARAALRGRAREWLEAELAAWKKVALTVGPANRETVAKTLAHWKKDDDFASVRDEKELAKLPEPEMKQWSALWADVDALLAKVSKP